MEANLSSRGDTCEAKPFWLRCIDCGGAVATAAAPDFPDTLVGLLRPFLKMITLKMDLSSELRAQVTGENPFAILGDEKLVPALFTLRCPDCTVKNGNVVAA